ncbi:hypothetical protein N7488_009635 [Penicillium malachiteum]|nr:hypothetical protein N7488_009635 [Penicillium malachiteum]
MPYIKKRKLHNSTKQSVKFLNEINSSYAPRQTRPERPDIYDIPDSPESPTFGNGMETRLRKRNRKPLSTIKDVESDEEPSEPSSEDEQMEDAPVRVPLETSGNERESDEEPSNEEDDQIGNQLVQLELEEESQEDTEARLEDTEKPQEVEAPEESSEPEESPESEDREEPEIFQEAQVPEGARESGELQESQELRRSEDALQPETSGQFEQGDTQEPDGPEERDKDEDYEEESEEEESEEEDNDEEESEEGDNDEEENQQPPSETPQAVIESRAVVIYDKNQSKEQQPRSRSSEKRRETLQIEAEEIQTTQEPPPTPPAEYTPDYEDLPRDDPDLKQWLREKVRGTHMCDEWMEFYVRAYKLPEDVNGPMPEEFDNALQLLACQRELHVDLEDRSAAQKLPVDFKSQSNDLCAAFFAEVEGILNFPDIPHSESDPEKAGDLVVDLEGYLLPYLVSLAVLAFKTYTRFGPGDAASSPLSKILEVLFKTADRIDALRDYYTTSRNRQKSWKLGMAAKRIKEALRKGKLRMFVTGDPQSPSEDRDVGDLPSVFDMPF